MAPFPVFLFLPTFPQQIMLSWQQNSQNRHFAFSCSKSRLRNWSSSCRAHCSGEQEPWYDFCLFLLLIFLVGAVGLGRTRVSLIIHDAGVSPPQSPEIFMMKLHNRGSRDHIEMLTWVSWSTLLLMSAPLYHLWTLSSAHFVWLDRLLCTLACCFCKTNHPKMPVVAWLPPNSF